MPSPGELLAFLDTMTCITTDSQKKELVIRLARLERSVILSFVNAHAVSLCQESAATLACFREADILLRDGVGVKAALGLLGRPAGLNMNGTDFIPHLLGALPPRRLALYGTDSPWLEAAAERIAATTTHRIVGLANGYHEDDHYPALAAVQRPELILLAMGMPRQERVAALLKRQLAQPALIVNGGAIADFIAGRFGRAPAAVRRGGLEWLFRLYQEPRRLFRRYGPGGLAFVHTVLRLRRAAEAAAVPATAPAYKEF